MKTTYKAVFGRFSWCKDTANSRHCKIKGGETGFYQQGQSQQASAKLMEMFEELTFWR